MRVVRQVAKRCCGCPISESVQSQEGQDSEQPHLEEGIPAHIRIIGIR